MLLQLGNSVSKCVTWVGTVTYMAPERIAGGNQGYGLPSDIWSLGVTVMECALGQVPLPGSGKHAVAPASGEVALQHRSPQSRCGASHHCMDCPLGRFTCQAGQEKVHL